MFTLYKQKQQS
jgi:hypothetical protein